MVLTPPMVFAQTDGIESVLLNHTRTRGPSVTRMRDFSYTIQSFYKIRSKKRKFCESEVGELLERRKIIKLELKAKPCEQKAFEKAKIEAKIAETTEQQFIKKVRETLGHITGDDGEINTNGIWRAKNQLIPKDKTNNPTVLKDKKSKPHHKPTGY